MLSLHRKKLHIMIFYPQCSKEATGISSTRCAGLRSLQNFIKSFAIRTEPEKCFFAAIAYRAKSSFGSADGLRCVMTTVLTPACADLLRRKVFLVHVAQPTLLFRVRLSLPGAVALHQPDHAVGVGYFSPQHVSSPRKVNDRVGPAGVAGEQKRTVQCTEAVGERFVLAVGRRAGLESEVSVLDRGYLDIGILIDDAGLDVVALKGVSHRSLLALCPPNFGIRCEVSESPLDQRFHSAAIDVGWLRALVLPLTDHQSGKPGCVVAMRMGDENLSNLPKVVARLNHARCHAASGIDQVKRTVDHKEIGGLRTVGARQRPAGGAKRHELRAGRWRGLRRDAIHGNHRTERTHQKANGQNLHPILPFLDHVTPSAYKPLCSPCARSSPTHAMNSGFTALPSG